MNADTIAALERAAEFLVNGGTRCQQDAALIRALIETLRAGGERAQIVAWLRKESIMSTDSVRRRMNKALDQIEAGAHVSTA